MRFQKTMLDEFYCAAFRKKLYRSPEELQRDADEWVRQYNEKGPTVGSIVMAKLPCKYF